MEAVNLDVLMWNIRGLPHSTVNNHKDKELSHLIRNYDAVVFLETGVSDDR